MERREYERRVFLGGGGGGGVRDGEREREISRDRKSIRR